MNYTTKTYYHSVSFSRHSHCSLVLLHLVCTMAGRTSDGEPNLVEPVFLKCTAIPITQDETLTTIDLCLMAEKVSGYKSMMCAQRIGGLWRLYPSSREARATLLVTGLEMKGVNIPLLDKNPFTMRDADGEEVPATRVTVSNVPWSCDDRDIEQAIEAQGVTLLTRVQRQLARDPKTKKLSRFYNGQRFMLVSMPKEPLPRKLKIGIFNAEVYHREQRTAAIQAARECFKCLEKGHIAAGCENAVKCKDCRQEGHRSGDPDCQWIEQAAMHEKRIHDEQEFPGMGDRSESQETIVTIEETAPKSMGEPSKAPSGAVPHKSSVSEKTKSRLRNFTFRPKRKSEANKNENEAADDSEEAENVVAKKPMVDTSKT